MVWNKNLILSLVAVLVVFVASFVLLKPSASTEVDFPLETSQTIVKIGGQMLKVDVVATPEDHARGLSGRESLLEDEGMLFVFNVAGKYGFWMKDMNFAIDMIWIGEDYKVVHIVENATTDSYPRVFTPPNDSKYVLETVSGFSKKNNIKVGDKLEILP